MSGGERYSLSEVDADTPQTLAWRLTSMLSRIADRLDKLEGLRDTATVFAPWEVRDSDGNLIHGVTTNTE